MTIVSADDHGPEWNLEKLYGRDHESQMIQHLADETATNILVIRGKAGSGKSYLMEQQPWKERGWMFVTGKFEQRRANEPYSALIAALSDLVDQWVFNNASQPICKMGAFQALLEEDIVFLKRILPKAYHVSSEPCQRQHKKTTKRKSGEAVLGGGSEYVNAAFWRILSFLCKPKPVVLFLDDLQWADQCSLDAIQVLATAGKVEGLLLAVAYRDEEVQPGDVVSKSLDFVRAEGGNSVQEIHVTDLDLENVNKMISFLLRQDIQQTKELAEVVHSKTLGNPFFVIRFLQMLRQDHLLTYSLLTFQWEWGNLDQIKVISDNVADVVISTMRKLPFPTQLALQISSLLGKVIPLSVMVSLLDAMKVEPGYAPMICEALRTIKTTGLKDVLDDAVKLRILTRSDDEETYMWSHDKLQQCAYSMIPEDFRLAAHGIMGQVLWKMSASYPDDEWMLYMAADQMNRSALDGDEAFAEDVARLSYEAAKLSIYKSAFFPAFEMIQGCVRHLTLLKDPWSKAYDLTLSIYSGLAEVGMRLGKYKEVEYGVSEVLNHSRVLEDKFRVYTVSVHCQISGNDRDYAKGLHLVQDILLQYGVKFPNKLLPGQLFVETRKLKSRLEGGLEALLKMQRLDEGNEDDRRHQHIITMLCVLATCCLLAGNKQYLAVYASTWALNISIKHGICAMTAMAVAHIGNCMIEEQHPKEAMEYAICAKKLVDSFPQELGSAHAGVHCAVVAGVMSATLPFNNTLDQWLEVNKLGLKIGDTEKASMGLVGYTYGYINVGLPLGPLARDILSFTKESKQFGMSETVKILFPIFHQSIKNLMNVTSQPTTLVGCDFDEEEDTKKFTDAGLTMTKRDLNSFKLMLACIFGKWDVAAELVDSLDSYTGADKLIARRHHRMTYMGIASVILGRKSEKKRSHFQRLGKKITKNFKDQIKNGSQNAHPVVLMLEALESPSKERFNEGIRTTARLGLLQYEALLCEQAGLEYLEKNDEGWAEYHIAQACNLYSEWGATSKSEQLKSVHAGLLKSSSISISLGSNLKGRSRYTPAYSNQMREVNWNGSSSSVVSEESQPTGSSTGNSLSLIVGAELSSCSFRSDLGIVSP